MMPDRVVVGAEDPRSTDVMVELYRPFTRTGAPIMVMDCASAELSKYAANAMVATRVSFMNETANLCERLGANVDHVRKAMAADSRIGASFLFPGIGYGGSCFPKDVKALVKVASDQGYEFRILRAVEDVNESQKRRLVEKMEAQLGPLKGKRIALWGLAFKPKTDDMREAPAITIVRELLAKGVRVTAYDPVAGPTAARLFGRKLTLADSAYEALSGADALGIVTEWSEFREPDFTRMRKLMRSPVIFDGRNIYGLDQMQQHGFEYFSIGR
jgi:UDPglucose 6-dehydrogenase